MTLPHGTRNLCEYCEQKRVAKYRARYCSATCRHNAVFGAIDDDAVVKLYVEEGLGLVATARRYGCGWKAVVSALKRKGHTTRPQGCPAPGRKRA